MLFRSIEHRRPGGHVEAGTHGDDPLAVDRHVGPATAELVDDLASADEQHGAGC